VARPTIQDEFSHIPSRQRRYQLRRKRDGFCSECGGRREHYATLCDACAIKQRRYQCSEPVTSRGRFAIVPDAFSRKREVTA